jgi:hypothetical protein
MKRDGVAKFIIIDKTSVQTRSNRWIRCQFEVGMDRHSDDCRSLDFIASEGLLDGVIINLGRSAAMIIATRGKRFGLEAANHSKATFPRNDLWDQFQLANFRLNHLKVAFSFEYGTQPSKVGFLWRGS